MKHSLAEALHGVCRSTCRMHGRAAARAVVAVLACLPASSLWAQVVRLPAVMPPEQRHPGQLVTHPGSSAELLQAPGAEEPALMMLTPPVAGDRSCDAGPRDARPGLFQKLIFSSTWLAAGGDNDPGMIDLSLKTVFAFPCPTRDSPLIITPGFAVHYLDGPAAPDLPPQVFDVYTQFRWMHRHSPRWAVDLAITPGVFSDFEQGADEALRITGHGAVLWTWTPTLKVLLGVAYLDREDIGVLPIGGLIWTPCDGMKFELAAPRPRIAVRTSYRGDVEDWLYVAGELGGGTWAIRRASGQNDLVTYRDWRAILGVQRKALHGIDAKLEVAYVFGRKLQYESPTAELKPAGTVMVRGGLTY